MLALLFTNIFDVVTPLVLKFGIDQIISHEQRALIQTIALYLLVMVGLAVTRYYWRLYIGDFQQRVAHDLRERLFQHLTLQGPSFFQKNSVGELMSLMTSDINSFRMAIGPGVLIFVDGILITALVLPVMIWMSWSWTWKTLILIPTLPFLLRRMEGAINLLSKESQERLSRVSAKTHEMISGIRVIKSYAQEKNQLLQYNLKSHEYQKISDEVAKLDGAFQPVMEAGVGFGAVILLYFCAPEASISIGTFVAFHDYIRRMTWPMSAIGMASSMFEQGRAAYSRILHTLETQTDIEDRGQKSLSEFSKLEIKNLNFRYPNSDRLALANINFTVSKGEVIGLLGPIGSGKSTLLHLLLRQYPAESGTILYNDISIEQIKQTSLYEAISWVPQEAFLFSQSVSDNITFGLSREPSAEELSQVTSAVSLEQEIKNLPAGFASMLGERGVNLSGGQKQRLTISRALVRKSQFIILDDSLSAVDAKTERALIQQIKSNLQNSNSKTVMIVSHRLAALQNANRIIVLNQGTIEAIGSPAELLKTSPTYRMLYDLQSENNKHSNSQNNEPVLS